MTDSTLTTRALVLTAVMVFGVIAGTVAFAGTTAATPATAAGTAGDAPPTEDVAPATAPTGATPDPSVPTDASGLVQPGGDSAVNLSENVTEVPRGGIATFTVRLNDSGSSATVVIGNESEDGYQANVSLTDANGDGVVTFAFNTYAAGDTSAETVVQLVGDSESDRITFDDTKSQTQLDSLLDPGDYLVSVGTSDDPATVLETPDFVGALFVIERSAPSQALWRTAQDTQSVVREAAANESRSAVTAIGDAIVDERLTRTDTLAYTPDNSNSDVLVVQLTAPGLSGVIGTVGGGEVTDEFSAALRSNNSSEAPLRVVLDERNPEQNRAPVSLDLGQALSTGTGIEEALTVIHADGDTYYVFVDYDTVAATVFNGSDTAFDDGDEIAVNSSLQDPRLLAVDPNEPDAAEGASRNRTASANVTLEAAEGGFDLNEDDLVTTTAEENATVTGTTNVAPGTEVTVVVRLTEGAQSSFLESRTVTVSSDGTFAATFNLSAQVRGDGFEVSVERAPFSATAEGVIVEGSTAEASAVAPVSDAEARSLWGPRTPV
ncbi:hypothetical protein GRX01_05600 [Halobaculum sp. WSA2]|uniref:DUF7827 domain-containing protein n=1 Tax=Halobaculum saliterrae TaxID=2073113 RepID=A0A6B0SPG6_9EURY|nr:BGTF surface domain-containing protein [Halobaculum saliterrae]MXR40814.1 hypothetical protein [Halobaculum saliterrae]